MPDILNMLDSLSSEKMALLEIKFKQEGHLYNIFPLSYAQQRLWFLNQLEPESTAYNIPTAVELTGSLNILVLEQCINEIINRHEILRTVFRVLGDTPVQIILPFSYSKLQLTDLCDSGQEEKKSHVLAIINEENQHSFNLESGPLIKSHLFKLSDDKFILCILMHHIISDGWSIEIFIHELQTLYSTYSVEIRPILPQIHLQYADYSVWQRKWLEGEIMQNQLNFWKQKLKNPPVSFVLPGENPKNTEKSGNSAESFINLSQKYLTAVHELCQKEGVTPFMVYLSILEIVLCRHTGQKELFIGTPVSNRNRSELEPLIGFFVNTIILRSRINEKLTFREYLCEIKKTVIEAIENQDLPFEKLVSELSGGIDMKSSPLFRIMYIYQKAIPLQKKLSGLSLNLLELKNQKVKYDLSFSITEELDNGIQINISYDASIFPSDSIKTLLEHYLVLFDQILINPIKKIYDFSVLTEQEKNKLLNEWNKTQLYPVSNIKYFHSTFEEQVRKNPGSIAVYAMGKQLTFSELNIKANKLANYLIKKGVGPEKVIGVCISRSIELLVCILGIFKSGGVYLPLDPIYPKNRLSFILEDSDAKFLICEEQLLSELPESKIEKIYIDKNWDDIACESDEKPTVDLFYENAAYIIYTSGSTGKPKGTIIQHNSLYNLYVSMELAYFKNYPSKSLRVCLNSTIMFDASILHILFILAGHCIYIIPDEIRRDPIELSKFVIDNNIDEVDCVPSVLKLLLAAKLFENERKPSLVLAGGEAIDDQTWKEIASIEGTKFYNNYGPTECTVVASMCPVTLSNSKPSIGKPLANICLYILDDNYQLLPIGSVGEIFIGGISVGRGYLNRPDLTAEKFIPDIYGRPVGGRLYRTGDLARYNPEGFVEFVGRTDHQVKVRGFRIETGEIETELMRYPEIKEAVVLLKEIKGEKYLTGYLTSKNGEKINIPQVKNYIGNELPYYMVPAFLIQLSSLPLLPNGKIDRKTLPDPHMIDNSEKITYQCPATPTEEILSEIMGGLLNIDKIGRNDNFFELGGHSLLATQLKSRINNNFRIDISLRTIFNCLTVEALAQSIDRMREDNLGINPVQIIPFEVKDKIPLSYAQERLWFLEQLEPGGANYNIPAAFRIQGKLNLALLEMGINNIISRHEIFRMKITSEEGRAVQFLTEVEQFKITLIDLRLLSNESQEKEIKDQWILESTHSFNLEKPPLLRIKILQTSDESCIFLLVMHHIISDGWSIGVFIRELMATYQNNESRMMFYEQMRIQYSDYAIWQRQQSQTNEYRNSINYWKNKLNDSINQINIPRKKLNSGSRSSKGKHINFCLEKEMISQIHQFCRAEEVTLFMFLLAAFKVLLFRYSRQNDISIGTTIANRINEETESLIGFFVNTLVLRDVIDDSLPFRALLKKVKNTCLDAYAHQSIPFEKIVDEIQPVRDTSQSPLFQIMFILQNNKQIKVELPGISIQPVDYESKISLFDITLVMEEYDGCLIGTFEFSTDLFEDFIVEQMIMNYKKLLKEILKKEDQKLSVIPILSDEEVNKLTLWERNQKEYESDKLIHTLFEKQVKRSPDSTAVVFNEERILYNELNCNANQLAHYILIHGVKPGMHIGISLDRSPALISALFAILKAGCAYVPLDTAYPIERLQYMIESSDLQLIVTNSDLKEKFAGFSIKTICLDLEADEIKDMSKENVDIPVNPENLAYIIFTSGSTGKPKGVMVRQESVVNHNMWISEAFQFTKNDKVLQFSTVNFDGSIEEIFPALQSGAAIILRNKGVVPSVQEILDLVRKESISILDMTTSYWQEIINEIHANGEMLPCSIRLACIGGDKVNIEKYKLWLKIGGNNVKLLNTYGPTETTVISAYYEVNYNDNLDDIPIGFPISNTKLYVLDKELQRVPPGFVGELYIGGVGVSNGYIHQPELTAEKYIPDPFTEAIGKVMYKTGDLARYNSDGKLFFSGRQDTQVKLRGLRIEPGEIEYVLQQHHEISNAVVTIRDNTQGLKQLAAYYQLREDSSLLSENNNQILRNYLRSKLPEYMVPSFLIRVDRFMLTPNGKIDIRALPDPKVISSPENEVLQNEKEIILHKVWKEVLGVEKISPLDNFFEIGGDSIMAIQIVAKAKKYGINIEPLHIFQNQTIRQLALIEYEARSSNFAFNENNGQVELTPIQIWFFEQKFPQQNYWNQSVVIELSEKVDVNLFHEAVNIVIKHHDMLRARFIKQKGWQFDFISPDNELPLEFIDFSHSESDQLKGKIEKIIDKAQCSLNIENGTVIKFIYFKMPAAFADILFTVAHHLIIDAVSWNVLLEDLLEAYRLLVNGTTVFLQNKTFPYSHWGNILKKYANQPEIIKEMQFWLNQPYEKATALDINSSMEDVIEKFLETVCCSFESETFLQDISQAEKNQNANTTDLLLTAVMRAYSEWSGKRSLLIDLEGHGRESLDSNLDTSRTIGWFTSIFPVVLDLKDSIDSLSALLEIKKRLHEVPNHGINFGVFKYLLGGEISKRFKALPESQICFNYLGKQRGILENKVSTKLLSIGPLQVNDRGPLNHLSNKLTITASIMGNSLKVFWSYCSTVFNKDSIQNLADIFSRELKLLIDRSNTEVSQHYLASDFPIAGIDQKKLNKILGKLK